jgi:hypothetical protein
MQNPAIFTNQHYKQAAYAVLAGIAIRIGISIPVSALSLTYMLIPLTKSR